MNRRMVALLQQADLWAMDLSLLRLSEDVDAMDSEKDIRTKRLPRVNGAVAVIPIDGPVTKRGGWDSTSMDRIGRVVDAAVASDRIRGIVLDIDSPGGTVTGTPELGEKIFAARGSKPIVALANPLAASAAFYLGTAADSLVATPSGDVGSVGVWSMHINAAKFYEDWGLDITLISAGKYKVEGHPFGPLDDAGREEFQRGVNECYQDFIATLAKHRGIDRQKVISDFGEGRVVEARHALKQGMIDRIDTMEGVLASMSASAATSRDFASDGAETDRLMVAWTGTDKPAPRRHSSESRRLRMRLRQRNSRKSSATEG